MSDELTDALPALPCYVCLMPADNDGPPEDADADGNVLCPACHAKAAAVCEPTQREVEKFTADYMAAMLWSSHDDSPGDHGETLDRFSPHDIDGESLEQIRMECYDFCRANAYDIESWERCAGDGNDAYGNAGHDFWLTRVGHGCGYWDGDWPERAGVRLDAAAKAAGNRDIYVGDDGKLHYCKG